MGNPDHEWNNVDVRDHMNRFNMATTFDPNLHSSRVLSFDTWHYTNINTRQGVFPLPPVWNFLTNVYVNELTGVVSTVYNGADRQTERNSKFGSSGSSTS